MIKWTCRRAVGLALGLTMLHLGALAANAGPKVEVGHRYAEPESGRPSFDEVVHSDFDALLQRYVDANGQVDYARWKATPADVQALEAYLNRLSCVNRRSPARRAAQFAYWINAYNALTLHGILREYPTSSIRNHTARFGGYNVWKDLLLWVDGQQYSLDDIEHAILRKMEEPRIHLALVCASKGCPPLWNRAYTADGLDTQLTANGQRFFASPANFRADSRARTVAISKLFEWYGTDFAPTPAGQLRALGPMLPAGSDWTWGPDVRVRYLNYDWSLNDQRPVQN
ncbi:DUF547 domain-containing protein [soil metagenome]